MPDPQHSCAFLECNPGPEGALTATLYPVLKHQIPFSVAEISQPKPLQAVKNGALNSERGVQMKKLLLGSVALAALGIGAPAIAADTAVRPAAPPAFSWTGWHIGGLVGYGCSGSTDGYTTTGASTTISATPVLVFAGQPVYGSFPLNGFNGGGYAGCDYQF